MLKKILKLAIFLMSILWIFSQMLLKHYKEWTTQHYYHHLKFILIILGLALHFTATRINIILLKQDNSK